MVGLRVDPCSGEISRHGSRALRGRLLAEVLHNRKFREQIRVEKEAGKLDKGRDRQKQHCKETYHIKYLEFDSNELWLNNIKSVFLLNFHIQVPLRRPWLVLSKAALVTSLKPEVKTPEAAKPAMKDCKLQKYQNQVSEKDHGGKRNKD